MTIKKNEIKTILDNYSIRPNEFEAVTDTAYKSKFARGYHIRMELKEDGRIYVYHTSRSGKRTHTDVWERTENGLEWFCRNTPDVPISDREVIKDLEKQIAELRVAGRKLQERLKDPEPECQKLSKNVGRPKETERIRKVVEKIKALIDIGCKDTAIMDQLRIPKATYYRYKRMIHS